jgi:hypothetical protein
MHAVHFVPSKYGVDGGHDIHCFWLTSNTVPVGQVMQSWRE